MESLIGIYGASGFGREVKPLVEHDNGHDATILFIDDNKLDTEVNGIKTVSWDVFLATDAADKKIAIAISDSTIREKLDEICSAAGAGFFHVQAKNAIVMDDVILGEGAIICPFVTMTSNIRIGRHFHANIYSYVAHDCVIGNYVTFAPSVKCNGNVHIEDHAYIGTAAILKQGTNDKPLRIGRGAIVGMGAVVTKDVEPGTVVVGNPARVLTKD